MTMVPDARRVAQRNMTARGKKWSRKEYVFFGPLKLHRPNLKHRVMESRGPFIRFVDCGVCGRRLAAGPSTQTIIDNGSTRPGINNTYTAYCGTGFCTGSYHRSGTRVAQVREAAYHWLKTQPCADCRQTFHPDAMEFDHLPEFEKVKDMSRFRTSGSLGAFIDELLKCELVCANCHRVRTDGR